MKVLVFDDKISGHHLEYIHHLYDMALLHQENQFVFVVPDTYNLVKDKFEWSPSANILFDLCPVDSITCSEGSFKNSIKKSMRISQFVDSYVKKHAVDQVFMISIMSLIPACVIKIGTGVKISGIIYQIYLYRDKDSSLPAKILDRLKYLILSRSSLFKNVYILNDANSADKLNSIYRSSRFMYLVDPYLPLVMEDISIRQEYAIPEHHKLLIHIGALEERKGTLEILQSIANLPEDYRSRFTFFFAGRVGKTIRETFYTLLGQITDVNVIVKDEFCSYGFFASLCKAADAILMPYKLDSASSGIIGYASQFKKPVIATSSGLIGLLVSKYRLGYLLPSVDEKSLTESYRQVLNGSIPNPDMEYCNTHTINVFQESIAARFNIQ